MMLMSPQAFTDSLPKTPLRQHITQVYTVLVYMHQGGDGYDEYAMEAATHSLREIARYTTREDWLRQGIRDEVLRDLGLPPGTTSAIRNPFDAMSKVIQQMKGALQTATPRDADKFGEMMLRRAIAEERRKGLAYVRAQARRVEQELGLTTTTKGKP